MSQENLSSGFLIRYDTNWGVQSQKMAKGLKFQIYEVESLYYLCSENKNADQLHGHRAADLRLCFRICKKTKMAMFLSCNKENNSHILIKHVMHIHANKVLGSLQI